jgi:hypothetical protein
MEVIVPEGWKPLVKLGECPYNLKQNDAVMKLSQLVTILAKKSLE